MLTLAKIEYKRNHNQLELDAVSIYTREMPKLYQDGTGWITVEPTPGTINFNPSRKQAAVRFYEHEPVTRRGYYVKLQVLPNDKFRSC